METKTCSKCGNIKAIYFFNKRHDSKDGHYSYCKDCCMIANQKRKESLKKHRIETNIINTNLENIDLTDADHKMISYLKKKDAESNLERVFFRKMQGWQTEKYQIFNEAGVFLVYEKDAFCYGTGRKIIHRHIYTKYF